MTTQYRRKKGSVKAARKAAKQHGHYHSDSNGVLVRCYRRCRSWAWIIAAWLVGQTSSFPLEHYLWEKVWPFYKLTEWLGL